MKRLTIRISGYAHGAEGVSADKLTGSYCRGEFEATACIEKLAEYEDLEEQGKLLKLPCAVGDTVWCMQIHSGGGRVPNWGEIFQSEFSVALYDDFGKTVFLTREEAEAALECLIDKKMEAKGLEPLASR